RLEGGLMDVRSGIGHVSIRSRIAEGTASDRRRLQVVWQELTAAALDRALDRVGLSGDEIVCIRQVDLHMRLWLGQTDEAMVSDWAAAVAGALQREITAGNTTSVVRFRSSIDAIVDAVRGLVRESKTRAWAWRQLELPVHG